MAATRLLVACLYCLACSGAISAVSAKTFTGFGDEIDLYIQEAAERYQISEAMLRGLIKMEDGWTNKIFPTGATGVGQFTVGTWNWLAEQEEGKVLGMTLITPNSRGKWNDPRRNKRLNTLATALLARWHIEQFPARKIPITDENLYMAHNIGLEGLHRALLGRATAEDIRNMKLNGMKKGMSVMAFLVYQKARYNTHKAEANFITVRKNAPINWVEPVSHTLTQNAVSMTWVEPSHTMVWVEPK